jgi:chromosome segregation ATPase
MKPDFLADLLHQFPDGSFVCMPRDVLAQRLTYAYEHGEDDGIVRSRADLTAENDRLRGELATLRERQRVSDRLLREMEQERDKALAQVDAMRPVFERAMAGTTLPLADRIVELETANALNLQTIMQLGTERDRLNLECQSWCEKYATLTTERNEAKAEGSRAQAKVNSLRSVLEEMRGDTQKTVEWMENLLSETRS